MKYLLLCRFHMFFEIFPTDFAFTFDAGFGEKCTGLMLSLLTDWAFYAVAFLFCYIVILLIFFTAVTLIIFVRIAEVRIVNHFHEITLLTFRFFFWMIGNLVRTSPGRLLFTLDGPEFDFFLERTILWEFWLAFLSVELGWVLMDERAQEWRLSFL